MKDTGMTRNQAWLLLGLFLAGNGLVFGMDGGLGRDGWAAVLLGLLMALPVFGMMTRALSLFPELDFFGLVRRVFGYVGGNIVLLLWTGYVLYRAGYALRGMTAFFGLTTLPHPPILLLPIVFVAVALYLAGRGNSNLGKWGVAASVLTAVVFLLMLAASVKDMNPSRLMPVLRQPVGSVIRGGWIVASNLLLDAIVFLPLLGTAKQSQAPRGRTLLLGGAAAGGFTLLMGLQTLLLLGAAMVERVYFPIFTASKIISVGRFLTRLETTVFLYIALTGVTMLAVYMAVGQRAFGMVSDGRRPGLWAAVMGLVVLTLSLWGGFNVSDVAAMADVHPFAIGAFFQFSLPVLLWLGAEGRYRGREGRKQRETLEKSAPDV